MDLRKQKQREDQLKADFLDIVNGYSQFFLNDESFFVKHYSFEDDLISNTVYDREYKKAQAKNVLTESDARDFVIKEGLWEAKKEDRIQELTDEILVLNSAKRHLKLSSEIKNQNKEIDKLNKEYVALFREREQLFGQTCECYADEKAFLDRSIRSIYRDKGLSSQIFPDGYESIQDLKEDEISEFFVITHGILKNFDETRFQKIAISDFFQSYFSLCDENITNFFGKPIIQLTFFQTRLGSWGQTFKFLRGRYDEKINEDMLENPISLLDHHWIQENQQKEQSKQKDRQPKGQQTGEFVTHLGASQKEIKSMTGSNKEVDPWEKIENKGGALDMMDFIEMQEGKKYRY